jgi:soluble lytic murein transglycosylase-like protein
MRWSDLSGDDADLFVELVTFSETRQYVRRIREQLAIYQALYGG